MKSFFLGAALFVTAAVACSGTASAQTKCEAALAPFYNSAVSPSVLIACVEAPKPVAVASHGANSFELAAAQSPAPPAAQAALQQTSPANPRSNSNAIPGSAALLQYSRTQDCFHNKIINPMCQVTVGGTTYNVFGSGDLISRINAVIAAGYSSGITIRAPPDTYSIGSVPMSIQSLNNFEVDLSGSIFHPSVANFTPFIIGNAPSANVRLVGGRFLPDPRTGTKFFGYAGGTYTKANYAAVGGVNASNPITGLDLYPEEVSGTAGAGINIRSLTNDNNTSWLALQKVRIRGWFHDTGGESISLNGCNDCLIDHVKSGADGLGGPERGFSPDNLNLSGSNIKVDNIDCSGTAIWNDTPFNYNAPAACIYFINVDGFSVTGNIHHSACTYALCDSDGRDPIGAQVTLPNGGTVANYNYMPDCIHVDASRRGTISITCSDYNRGIVTEVSHNVTVSNSAISQTYSYGLQENSRNAVTLVNQLSSAAGLVAGKGVISMTAGTRIPNIAAPCSNGCTQFSLPAHFAGTVVHQDNASVGWSTFNMYPQFQTIASVQMMLGGTFSLFLSPSASCTDPRGITLPFPQIGGPFLDPILQPYFLDVPNTSQMAYMTSIIPGGHVGGFVRWCVNASDTGAAATILVLGGLQFNLLGEGNVFSNDTISRTGEAAIAVTGPGIGPNITGINITDPVVYGSNIAAGGGGVAVHLGVGDKIFTRTGFSFTDSTVNLTRSPQSSAYAFPAMTIGDIGTHDAPILDPVVRNITFLGAVRPDFIVNNQASSTPPYLDLHTSGIVGLKQTSSDMGGETTLASGTATVALTQYYSARPRFSCTDESPKPAPVNCYASPVSGNKWQLNIVGTGTDLISYTKASE